VPGQSWSMIAHTQAAHIAAAPDAIFALLRLR
jgi:hypothetical protein